MRGTLSAEADSVSAPGPSPGSKPLLSRAVSAA